MRSRASQVRLRFPRHVGWVVTDQALSSASNLLVLVVAARTSSVEEFGAFSVAYLVYSLVLGIGRATGGEVLLLRAAERPDHRETACRGLLAVAVGLGAAGSALAAGAALMIGSPTRTPLLALAVVLPVVLAQDALRYCYFAQQRPARAALNDLLWLLAQIGAFSAVALSGTDLAAPAIFIGWGAAAGLALGVGLTLHQLRPEFGHLTRWFTRDRARVGSFLGDFLLMIGSGYVAIQLVGVVAGLGALAALRGADLLFAPLAAGVSGIRLLLLPRLARVASGGSATLRAASRSLGTGLALLAAAWAVLVLLLPDTAGRALLGDTWEPARALALAFGVLHVLRLGTLPALDALRVLGGGRHLVSVRAMAGVLTMTGTVGGAALADAQGAATGMAVAFGISAGIAWLGLAHRSRLLPR